MTSQPPPDSAALLFDQRWLAALARGLVGDEHAVEDVLQETRLRAWRHPPADTSGAGGWLRRVATNVALSMRSSESARRLREVSVARPEQTYATDELVARVEMQRAVAEAVLRLDEPYRAAILLRFFDDLPPREIAERLGLPVETVRTRLKRGLAQLRGQLDRRYGERGTWAAILAPGLPFSGGVAAMSTASKTVIAATAVLVLTVGAFRIGDLAGDPMSRPGDVAPDALIASRPDSEPEVATPVAEVASLDDAASRSSIPVAGDGVRFTGMVLDADTFAPVADAIVKLRYRGGEPKRVELETRSRADGSFEAGGANVTRLVFSGEVAHADYATTTVDPAQAQSAPQTADGAVGLGAILMRRGTFVSGRVVMLPDRSSVGGAELFVCDRANYPVGEFGATAAWRAGRSRVDGTFDLDRRVAATEGPLAILAVSEGRVGFAFLRPERSRDRLADFEVSIEPQGSLVVNVIDEQGRPLPNVELKAVPTFPPFGRGYSGARDPHPPEILEDPWRSIFRAITGADGRARFPALPEGRADSLLEQFHPQSYRVHAFAASWPSVYESALIARGQETTLEIKLGPDACTGLVRGRILDDSGGPIAGALVRVEGFADARSGTDGRYATAPRPGRLGDLRILVSAEGFAPDEFGATRGWTRSKLVTQSDDPAAPPREEIECDFTLARATTVRGRVVDESGAPLAGIAVQASGLNEDQTRWVTLEATGRTTGADGAFVIEGVSLDSLTLTVEPPDGYLHPFPARVVPGDQDMLVTVLRSPVGTGRVVAQVFDSATGLALDPVMAFAEPTSTGSTTKSTARCSPGQVVADELFVGSWELVVHVNDGRRARARFEITRPDETVELKMPVEAEGIVEGVLFNSKGEPMRPEKKRWWVWVRPSSNDSRDSGHALDDEGRPVSGVTDGCAVFDENGRFRVGRLSPGLPIRFVVDGKDTSAHVTVDLKPGETRRVEFHLKKSADVQWHQSQALPPGRLKIETALGDGPFAPLVVAPTGRAGTLLERERMSPGRMRWRAEFTPSGAYPPRVRVASGTVELTPGEPTIVDVLGFE